MHLIIYHKDCFDGFGAAYIAKNCFDSRSIESELHAAAYGTEPPNVTGKDVYILDFSYKRDVMINIANKALSLTVLDHHKTAQEALKDFPGIGNTKIVFDMGRSGIGITWDFLYPNVLRPPIVDYVEDRDIWRWELKNSKEIAAYVASVPMTFSDYDDLWGMELEECVQGGRAILKYIDLYGEKACASARIERIGDYSVPTMNLQYMNTSEHVNKLCQKTSLPFAAGYFRRADGKWQFSLRSIGDFDVSEIAKLYGGGGHKNAAGFELDKLPW